MADVLLEDDFLVCALDKGRSKSSCRVVLTQSCLKAYSVKKSGQKLSFSLNTADVIGCTLTDGKQAPIAQAEFQSSLSLSSIELKSESNPTVHLTIYAYTLSKNLRGIEFRKKEIVTLSYTQQQSHEENEVVANRWKHCILSLARGKIITAADVHLLEAVEAPKLLVFVNPKSGTGSAVRTFKDRLAVLFDQAGIAYDLIVTNEHGHAMNYVLQLADLNSYRGIVVVSGDGLLHEVYNGLFKRDDYLTALSFPVGIISQGSGNALARSLASFNNEPYLHDPALVSCLNVIKLRTTPTHLALVTLADNTKICSFLSLGWGLIADIDIESERLRSIGEARFTVWAIARVLRLRKYRAKLSYLPAKLTEDYEDRERPSLPSLDQPVPNNWTILDTNFVCVYGALYPFLSSDMHFAPQSTMNDGRLWLLVVSTPVSKLQLSHLLVAMSDGSHVKFPWLRFIPVEAFRLEPEESSRSAACMTIDGEKIPSQKIQVEVLKGAGTVFMR